ncbi:MAG: hypothetical protein RIR90_1836 [Bacteroidota bacterium]|jgi:lysozyme
MAKHKVVKQKTIKSKARTKKPAWKLWLPVGILAVLLIGNGWFVYQKWKADQQEVVAKRTSFEAFGISMPADYSIHGIDVSSYQGAIYWPGVKQMKADTSSLSFAFIKATEGLNDVDKRFAYNWAEARKAGLVRGAYHYFLATKSGKKQAENFLKNVPLLPGDLPPVVDIEKLHRVPRPLMRKRLQEWLDHVEQATGRKPIIYTFADFYEKELGPDFNAYPLWVAHYFQPERPRINRPWSFWQHSDQGQVSGITMRVDFNVFSGNQEALRQLLLP